MATKSKGGRPRIISSPKEFERLANEYFKKCRELDEPVLLTGLVDAVGLSSKHSLYEYRDREEFSYSVKKALLQVEMSYEKSLRQGGNAAGDIFALKNFEWKDKHEVDANVNNRSAVVVTPNHFESVESWEAFLSTSK